MLSDNIRKYRQQCGFSQEELADKLNVVRQTISKWEKGLSVPDADMLLKLSDFLGVSVNELLGCTDKQEQELAELRTILQQKEQQAQFAAKSGKIYGKLIFLSVAAAIIMISAGNTVVSLVLSGAVMLTALVILYRSFNLLTIDADKSGIRAQKSTAIFSIVLLVICVTAAILSGTGVPEFSEQAEKVLAVSVICAVMIFAGIISPRLPFSRHTGLRLPWTIQDETSWNIAHKLLGWISVPLAVLYIACAFTTEYFEAVTAIAVCLWLGIPSIVSGIYCLSKMNNKF